MRFNVPALTYLFNQPKRSAVYIRIEHITFERRSSCTLANFTKPEKVNSLERRIILASSRKRNPISVPALAKSQTRSLTYHSTVFPSATWSPCTASAQISTETARELSSQVSSTVRSQSFKAHMNTVDFWSVILSIVQYRVDMSCDMRDA